MEFQPLLEFENKYEIQSQYPFTIRRISDHYEIKDCVRGAGYVTVNLEGRSYDKHRLIAKQFIPNDDPEHKTQVDHINRDRKDYHLENLRWVSSSENLKNRTKVNGVTYEFCYELPENCIKVLSYKSKCTLHEFNDDTYYYDIDNEEFYVRIKDNLYKKMHISIDKNNSKVVRANSVDGCHVGIYVEIFKAQYDL